MAPPNGPVAVVSMSTPQWTEACEASGSLKCWIAGQSGSQIYVKRAPKAAVTLNAKPQFDVDDDSRIEVSETTSAVATELASKGFSESGIQATLAGGAHGLTAGLAGDIEWKNEMTSTSSQAATVTKLHCSYYFPRVRMILTAEELALSETCKKKLEELGITVAQPNVTDDKFNNFFHDFGGVFAQEVYLGGRLYGTESVSSATESQILERKNEMQTSLSATFMAPFIGVSLGGHHQKGLEVTSNVTTSSGKRGTSIVAHGGNSLLSWDPPQWAPTVEYYHNWRPIQQDNIIDLPTLLSKIAGIDPKYGLPIQALKRKLDERINQQKAKEEDTLKVLIGNTWRDLAATEGTVSNRHRWTYLLQFSLPEKVDNVVITLHRTFTPNNIQYRSTGGKMEDISITRDGWGVFNVKATVTLTTGWSWLDDNNTTSSAMDFNWELSTQSKKEHIFPMKIRSAAATGGGSGAGGGGGD